MGLGVVDWQQSSSVVWTKHLVGGETVPKLRNVYLKKNLKSAILVFSSWTLTTSPEDPLLWFLHSHGVILKC